MSLIITPTYSRNERYCDTLVQLMDRMWPGHPDIWFLTDGNTIAHKNTIRFPGANWTQILHSGLKQIRSMFPEIGDVYVILEDLYPLWECQAETLARVHQAARKTAFGAVLFFTHECQPMAGGERAIDGELTIDGVRFERLSPRYSHYSSLQPALWNLEHLMSVTEYALRNNLHDPWRFEFINLGSRVHYMSEYHWPCIFGGLFSEGRVNLKAVRRLAGDEFAGFRRRLLVEYWQQMPGFALRRTIRGVRGRYNRVLGAMK
jgi:hypothetical protein